MSPLGALLWVKGRIARHMLAGVRRESRLKVALVSLAALGMWLGLFVLAAIGLDLLQDLGADFLGGKLRLADLVMARLLSFFALTIFVLLIFSNALISYATFFRSREMPFLVQSPIDPAGLFLGRFVECLSFSSWASAFLASPLLLAYGRVVEAPLLFYLASAAFFLPFVIIPAALGCLATFIAVPWLGKIKKRSLLILALLLPALLIVLLRARLLDRLGREVDLQTILALLGQSEHPLLPSRWLADGVLQAATGAWSNATFSLLLLIANAAFLLWLATLVAEKRFIPAWNAVQNAGELANAAGTRRISSRGFELLGFLPEPGRSLWQKDLRLFWREPAQWSQFVIFFGLMALYLANLGGRVPGGFDRQAWQAWGSLLNLIACLLILASLTSRFVYPLVSLEGKRFWILGLAPLSRRRIVGQKFLMSVASTALFTFALAALSAWRLELDAKTFALTLVAVLASTFALCGLAVGLGALYANFQEDNPARIVSGLGGTLNFLLSLILIALVILGLAPIVGAEALSSQGLIAPESRTWIQTFAALFILFVTTLATWLPLKLGIRHIEGLDL